MQDPEPRPRRMKVNSVYNVFIYNYIAAELQSRRGLSNGQRRAPELHSKSNQQVHEVTNIYYINNYRNIKLSE